MSGTERKRPRTERSSKLSSVWDTLFHDLCRFIGAEQRVPEPKHKYAMAALNAAATVKRCNVNKGAPQMNAWENEFKKKLTSYWKYADGDVPTYKRLFYMWHPDRLSQSNNTDAVDELVLGEAYRRLSALRSA